MSNMDDPETRKGFLSAYVKAAVDDRFKPGGQSGTGRVDGLRVDLGRLYAI